MIKQPILALAVVVLLAGLAGGVYAGTYSGGTGEPNDPYRIATPNDLNDIDNHVEDYNKCFVLVNDINLADYNGMQFNIIGSQSNPFTGVFDGNGHAISNFTCNRPEVSYPVALFSYAGDPNCEIKDLTLSEPNIVGGTRVSALVGRFYDGRISNCHIVSGKILGSNLVAGLIASCESGTIVNSSSYADVNGGYGDFAGGLVAVGDANISGCFASGNVSGFICVGGLVGRNGDTGRVTRCYATGNVSGEDLTGGLVGASSGRISNCYATSDVSGVDNTGGLMGIQYIMGRVENCFSTGRVSGSQYTGGFAGYIAGPFVTKCFWNSEVNPHVNGIGNTTDPDVIGKSTAEMMQECTFTNVGWDFVEVWNIGENQTYPFLRKYSSSDINHDDIVNFFDVAILGDHWLEGTGP